ncbi:hypothetical protein T10_4858 [Trichinella papuae]|uniref:Uncharacterized protein n=1 Tax=Trichinella papuae TaxID=268474 RepID=A0A0V1MW73_9BILA|nr:hypothetical protein T10_4858 [Trichinella papuae]
MIQRFCKYLDKYAVMQRANRIFDKFKNSWAIALAVLAFLVKTDVFVEIPQSYAIFLCFEQLIFPSFSLLFD